MYSPELTAENKHFPGRLVCVNTGKHTVFLCLPSVQRIENVTFSSVRNHFSPGERNAQKSFPVESMHFPTFFHDGEFEKMR